VDSIYESLSTLVLLPDLGNSRAFIQVSAFNDNGDAFVLTYQQVIENVGDAQVRRSRETTRQLPQS